MNLAAWGEQSATYCTALRGVFTPAIQIFLKTGQIFLKTNEKYRCRQVTEDIKTEDIKNQRSVRAAPCYGKIKHGISAPDPADPANIAVVR
jgi:hypothetical protein